MREFRFSLKPLKPGDLPTTDHANLGDTSFLQGDFMLLGSSERADMRWHGANAPKMPPFKAILKFVGLHVEITLLDDSGLPIVINDRPLTWETKPLMRGDTVQIGDATYTCDIFHSSVERQALCCARGLNCTASTPLQRTRIKVPETFREAEWLCPDCRAELIKAANENDLLRGKRFGRFLAIPYSKSQSIVQGTSATIYRAVHEAHGVIAAIKVPREGNHEKFQRFIQRELPIHEQLKHPKIVTYYGHGGYGRKIEQLYLAMEFLGNGTLLDFMNSAGAQVVSHKPLIGIMVDVFSALAHVHLHRYAYRYISPTNVLLTSAMPGGAIGAKLGNFNLALDDGRHDVTEATLRHTMVFIPPEIPPAAQEQYDPVEIGVAGDIYCASVMLYWMLSGETPDGLDISAKGSSDTIRNRRKHIMPEPLQEVCKRNERFPHLTQGLTDKIDKWVNPDPRNRWDLSAAYIADFLRAYL